MSGNKAKVLVGLILFCFVFTLKFLNGNCQVVTAQHSDLVADESRLNSQAWTAGASLMIENPSKGRDTYNNDQYQTWNSDNGQPQPRRQKKRKRRPQKGYTTESNELRSTSQTQYWRGQNQNDESAKEVFSPLPSLAQRRRNSYQNKQAPTEFSERVREPLAALEKEQTLSQLREKQRVELASKVTSSYRDKSYRKPYGQGKKDVEDNVQPTLSEPTKPATIDLKNILKNSGGLSLSEILQQKNLSLDDLLKGKKTALLALQTSTTIKPEIEKAPATTVRYMQPQRGLPSSLFKPTASQAPTSAENTQTIELSGTLQTSTKEKQQLVVATTANEDDIDDDSGVATFSTNIPRKNIFFPLHSKLRVGISSTTEKVPKTTYTTTHRPMITMYKKRPQYRPKTPNPFIQNVDSLSASDSSSSSSEEQQSQSDNVSNLEPLPSLRNRKPQRSSLSSTSTTTTTSTKPTTLTSTTTAQPSTSTTAYQFISTTFLPESFEEKLNKTNPEDNFVDNFNNENLDDVETLDELFEESYLKPETDSEEATPSISSRADSFSQKMYSSTSQSESISDNNSALNDRYELLELMEDRRSGNRLFKVLAQRNMTLDELIDHRRRGSSELHLAQIAENRTKLFNDAQRRIFHNKLDIVTAFENFPHFNLANLHSIKPDEIKTDSQGSSYFTSIIDIEPTDEIVKDNSGPTMQAQQQSRHEKSLNFFPSWKTLALASLTSQESTNLSNLEQQTLARHISSLKSNDLTNIESDVGRAHDLVDLELSGHGFKRSTDNNVKNLSSGIRSAIVASSAIVIISLATFMIIFTICRWRQKQRMKLNYSESYNAMHSKLPAVISRQSALDQMEEIEVSSPIIFPGTHHGGSLNSSHFCTTDTNSETVKDYLFGALRKQF